MKNLTKIVMVIILVIACIQLTKADFDPKKTVLIYYFNPSGEFTSIEAAYATNELKNYLASVGLFAVDVMFSNKDLAHRTLKEYLLYTIVEVTGIISGIEGYYSNVSVEVSVNIQLDNILTEDLDLKDSVMITSDVMPTIIDAKADALAKGLIAVFRKNITTIKQIVGKTTK